MGARGSARSLQFDGKLIPPIHRALKLLKIGDHVEVRWYDTHLYGPWRDFEEIGASPNLREVRTAGYVVRVGRYSLTIASSMTELHRHEYLGDNRMFGGTWTIPLTALKAPIRVISPWPEKEKKP